MKKVDIIIPIYNAYEFTKKCIETVIEHTDLTYHTLVMIDDKSPDERVLPMLQEMKQKHKNLNMLLIHNEENQGFVKTVNIGMRNSSNDVILLNSDTEVTKNWIEKMQICANSKPMVATVTPLSNNATLASVPVFNAENDIPTNMSLEDYASRIEKCSMKLYPEIPTAHGFCMYIKREAIEEIGFFDDIVFEKGYGEENDFSYRCLEAGYRHLLCDDTFIYHKGTQSFSEAKTAFILSHLKILKDKYPQCFANTDQFVRENPIESIQQNIIYAINSYHRKNVLILVHDFRELQDRNLGGTTLHVYDLIHYLREKMNFHIVYPYLYDGNYYIKSFFQDSEYTQKLGKYTNYTTLSFYHDEFRKDLDSILQVLKIDLIHIHHLKGLYLDIFELGKVYQIPMVYTLHDFYSICPTIQLINEKEEYCGNIETKKCEVCLKKRLNLNVNVIPKWQKEFHKYLNWVDQLIVPSDSTKKEVLKVYPDLKIKVIEHGFDVPKQEVVEKEKKEEFPIAFIGGINEHKGLKYLKELIEKVKGTDIVIHLFGTTSDASYNISKPNYIYHGVYHREEIIKLLQENQIKIACMLQIWPETYSYILTESFGAKVPVIALDFGAVSDRVRKIGAGYILPVNATSEDVYQKILEVKANVKDYEEKVKNIENYLKELKSIRQMCDEYDQIYHQLIENKPVQYQEDKVKSAKQYFYKQKEFVLKLDLERKRYNELNEKYAMIVNSKRWKMIGKFQWPKVILKLKGKKK